MLKELGITKVYCASLWKPNETEEARRIGIELVPCHNSTNYETALDQAVRDIFDRKTVFTTCLAGVGGSQNFSLALNTRLKKMKENGN